MKKKSGSLVWGIFLIAIGIVFFIGNVSEMGMDNLWPVFPLAVGLALCIGFLLDRSSYGLLMPGTILVAISILFFYEFFKLIASDSTRQLI